MYWDVLLSYACSLNTSQYIWEYSTIHLVIHPNTSMMCWNVLQSRLVHKFQYIHNTWEIHDYYSHNTSMMHSWYIGLYILNTSCQGLLSCESATSQDRALNPGLNQGQPWKEIRKHRNITWSASAGQGPVRAAPPAPRMTGVHRRAARAGPRPVRAAPLAAAAARTVVRLAAQALPPLRAFPPGGRVVKGAWGIRAIASDGPSAALHS